MTDFKREERYIVVKIKDMTPAQRVALQCHLEVHGTPTRECVVVEPDWPIYEETWENVQRLAEGRPSIGEECDALEKAITDEGLELGEYHSGFCVTETSLARIKAQWQADVLMDYHRYRKGAERGGREPMSANEWASEVLERARQAEEDA